MKKIITYTIIFIVISITMAEIGLRVVYREQLKTIVEPKVYMKDDVLGFTGIPNAKSEISIPDVQHEVQMNNQGFSGPDFPLQKAKGRFRIAVVGLGETAGLYIEKDKVYPSLLQDKFEKNGFENIEVINFGVGGETKGVYQYNWVKKRMRNYDPDLVVFVTNVPTWTLSKHIDVYKDYVIQYGTECEECENRKKEVIDEIEKHKFLTTLYDLSYIVRMGCKYYVDRYDTKLAMYIETYSTNRIKEHRPYALIFRYSFNKTLEILNELKILLAEDKIQFAICIYTKSQVKEEYVKQLVKNDINVIELDMIESSKLHLKHSTGLWNEYANRQAADRLYTNLSKGAYLPDETKN